ncbi:MAG: hypothetical protein JKX99_05560 [Robiginitomaculum sp.]|nr:hypothetical protein [Robiginitomaculum sp.]
MKNPNEFIQNLQRCTRLRENRRKIEEQRSGVIQEVHRQRERVGTRKGEIKRAENKLSNLIANARDIGTDSVSLAGNMTIRNGRGAAQDITKLAISIANAQAKQRNEIARIQRFLEGDEALLQAKQNEQAGIRSQINDAIRLMTSNDC